MRGRRAYKGQARKSQEVIKFLEQKLRMIAEREASVRAEAYEMFEIVICVIGELEDAGDELVEEYKGYEKGRKTYQGGSFIGRLIRAVIKFINRWTISKEKLDVLIKKQESMNKKLEEGHGRIDDLLRTNLRDVVKSDARSLKEMDEELRPATQLSGAPQLKQNKKVKALLGQVSWNQTNNTLQSLCRDNGIKVFLN